MSSRAPMPWFLYGASTNALARYPQVPESRPGRGMRSKIAEVHHADRLAGELTQPADPAGGFAFVPVEEAGFEALVGDVAVVFGGPGAAEGGDRRAVGAVGDSDDRGRHGPRAYRYRRGRAMSPVRRWTATGWPRSALAPRGAERAYPAVGKLAGSQLWCQAWPFQWRMRYW